MNLLPRRASEVTSLSPGVESLLRSLPRVEAPADARMRLYAAHERGERGRDASASVIPLWSRFAIPASAAAAVVIAVGVAVGLGGTQRPSGSSSVGGSMIAMVAHGSVPAPAAVAMRVVDDPSIPMASGSSGSAGMPLALGSWSADGLDGP